MTTDQIKEEAMKPSTHWVEAGSGSLGKVYIEILSCDGLPNMDRNKISSRTTDAFACAVFEDSLVNTDVIVNSTSPRWMPWCRRAFVFNILHPSSNILLGIFDWDMESSPVQMAMSVATDVHDPIARVMINVANTVPDTMYTVTVSNDALSFCETGCGRLSDCLLPRRFISTVPSLFREIGRVPTKAAWDSDTSCSKRDVR